VSESVTVSGASPVIETTRSQVSETSIANLPVNGRNFIDFALLTPGVTRDVRTGDISFAGQRGTLNSVVVDGADNNNTFFGQALGRTGSGRAPYQFSQDAVQEFQVNSNAYSAEYGRAGGAVIQRRDQVGHEHAPRVGLRVLPGQEAERQRRDQRAEQSAEVAVSLQPVRREFRRPAAEGPAFRVRELRWTAEYPAQ